MAENYATTGLKKLKPLFVDSKRYLVAQGGMRAAKTYSMLMLIISWCQTNADKVATVASMSYPHLSRGAIRDFQTIMKAADIWEPERWNQSSKIYTFGNGTILEFISVDNMSAHGPARDLLFVNEANDMDFQTFQNLAFRTTGKVIIDYNPTHEFWAHQLVKDEKDNADFIILTYKDNEALAPSIRKAIESRRPKPGEEPSNWWTVYGLGQIGSLEGNVYSGWTPISEVPSDYVLRRYGVDFGFSNDPTAIVGVYENENGDIILDEKLCETKVLTPQLVSIIKELPDGLCVCDNARPEIIAELQANGIRAIPCNKTAGEKLNGKRYNIELVQRRQIKYTSRSKELEREYLSYAWRRKKTGEYIDEPQDGNDHIMDAIAYAIRDMERPKVEYGGVL